jgi:hypothetical protein
VTYEELTQLASEYFGDRSSNEVDNHSTESSSSILYDAFIFEYGLGHHREFEGGIRIELRNIVTGDAVRKISLNSDGMSVLRNFSVVDKYCRRRLPRKYLEEFERAPETGLRDEHIHTSERTPMEHRMTDAAPNSRLTYEELTDVAPKYFGTRLSNTTIRSGEHFSTGVLYNAFVVRYGINEDDEFEGGVMVGSNSIVTAFFGHELSRNSDRESVLENFALIDKYCRLRLPDKYLRAFDLTSWRR